MTRPIVGSRSSPLTTRYKAVKSVKKADCWTTQKRENWFKFSSRVKL